MKLFVLLALAGLLVIATGCPNPPASHLPRPVEKDKPADGKTKGEGQGNP